MGVGPRMKTGKITVTTAEASDGKNVNVGFIPSYVKLLNEDAAVAASMQLEKYRDMPDLTSLITKRNLNTVESPVMTTTDGLSNFDANQLSQPETALTVGTSITPAGNKLTGIGTLFTTEIAVGDRIRIGSQLLEVQSITDDLELFCTSDFSGVVAVTSAERVIPGAETSATGGLGFTIPASFMGAGDVLHYMALISEFDETDPVPAV